MAGTAFGADNLMTTTTASAVSRADELGSPALVTTELVDAAWPAARSAPYRLPSPSR